MALQGALAAAVQSIQGGKSSNGSGGIIASAKAPPIISVAPQTQKQSFAQRVISLVRPATPGSTPTPFQSAMNSTKQQMFGAVQGGIDQIKQANQTVNSGTASPLQGGEAGLSAEAGVGQIITSPLAPIFNVISKALQGNPNKPNIMSMIVNNPDVQKFAMSSLGKTTSRVATDLANAGTVAGTILGADQVAKGVTNNLPSPKPVTEMPLSQEEIGHSRTSDVTPDYNKSMIGKNVMTPDTVDAQGNQIKGAITPRIGSEGVGNFDARPVTTSASEAASAKELSNIPNYPDNGTYLEKGLSVQKAIGQEAQGMRAGLQAEDASSPLDTTKEQTQVRTMLQSNVSDNVPNFYEKGFPKTAAGKYYQAVYDAADSFNGTREGLLDLRQKIDGAYENARGKLAWGTDSQNALDEAHTDIRDNINKELADKSKSTDTQASLRKQSNLYRAQDVLNTKAQAESATAYGRLVQKYPMLGKTATILQRQGVMLPLRIVEAGLGVAALGTYLHNLLKQQ